MTRMTHYTALTAIVFLLGACTSTDDSKNEITADKSASTGTADQSNKPPVGPKTATPAPAAEDNVSAVTFGRGIASANGLDVTFMLNVTRFKDGTASGEFKQSASAEAGLIDIDAEVTCAELDSESGKGWIGGKVTRNQSSNPLYISAVGSDVWFRILDLGEKEQTALITLPVFPQKSVKTAAAFCKKKAWSDKDLLEIKTGALAIFP